MHSINSLAEIGPELKWEPDMNKILHPIFLERQWIIALQQRELEILNLFYLKEQKKSFPECTRSFLYLY